MALPQFAVTFDYRCPFARTVHEHLVLALQGGAGFDVTFLPFSLDQAHVAAGEPDVWADPAKLAGQTATLVALAVRDTQPEHFLAVHLALFTARHEHQLDVRDGDAVARVVDSAAADGPAALAEVATGRPLATLAAEHQRAVAEHDVFGVPTFLVGDDAVFIRLTERAGGDAAIAAATIDRIIDTITGWPSLNELKHTRIAR
ncbi:MAG: DsbA family protein [Acidimicrobiales bacterium]